MKTSVISLLLLLLRGSGKGGVKTTFPISVFVHHSFISGCFLWFLIAAAVLHETGNTVSLSCDKLTDNQKNCNATTWSFKSSRKNDWVKLVALGQIVSNKVDLNKVQRLHVLENCSLEIKDVAAEDIGVYQCRQHLSGEQGPDTQVDLALISSKSFTKCAAMIYNLFLVSCK